LQVANNYLNQHNIKGVYYYPLIYYLTARSINVEIHAEV
jgi:hypothetical protein